MCETTRTARTQHDTTRAQGRCEPFQTRIHQFIYQTFSRPIAYDAHMELLWNEWIPTPSRVALLEAPRVFRGDSGLLLHERLMRALILRTW